MGNVRDERHMLFVHVSRDRVLVLKVIMKPPQSQVILFYRISFIGSLHALQSYPKQSGLHF